MEYFPRYYTRLFNSITDAIEALKKQNYIKAQDILIRAQQDAEEMYLEDGDEDDKRPQYTTVDLTPIDADAEVPTGELIILDRDKVSEKFRQIAEGDKSSYPQSWTAEMKRGQNEETEKVPLQ